MPAAAATRDVDAAADAPGSKEQMIAGEMEKFREKQRIATGRLSGRRRRKGAPGQGPSSVGEDYFCLARPAKKRTLGMKVVEAAAAEALGVCADRARARRAQAQLLARRRAAAARGFKPGLATSAFGAEEASRARVLQKLDDDESAAPAPSLSDNQSSARAATDDDAKKRDRAIAEAIPTDADQLFKATVDWAAVRSVSYVYLYDIIRIGRGARASSRPSCGPGSPKNRRVSGGRRTHTDQLRLFLLRAKGQARGDPRRARAGLGRRCPNHGRQAVARVTLPREGGAAPLCVKNIFAGVFSYPFRRFFGQRPAAAASGDRVAAAAAVFLTRLNGGRVNLLGPLLE